MPKRFRVFFIFLLAYFLSYFFRSTNAVIADDLVRDLALSPEQLGAMTGVFFAAFALVQFPLGFALDHLGARLTTGGLLMVAVAGSLIFASAESYTALLLGRALIGLGMAGALMGSLKMFSRWFPAKQFALVSGIFVAFGASGALLATTPLEQLSQLIGWRQIFVAGALATLISSLLILLFTRNNPLSSSSHAKTEVSGSLKEILRKPAFWQLAFLNLSVVGSFFAYQSLWMGPFLRGSLRLSPTSASNMLFVLSAASILGYLISGWLASRLGLVKSISLMSALLFGVQLSFAFLGQASPNALLVVLLIAFGFVGAFNIIIFSHVRHLFPDNVLGRVFAFINFFGFSGIAFMQWLLGLIIGRYPLTPTGAYAPEAFQVVFVLTACLGLLSVTLYLPFLKQSKLSKFK